MKAHGCRNLVTGLLILLATVSVSYPPTEAHAAGVRLDTIPSLRLDEGWYSNVYNTSTDEVSSFGTRVAPTLALRLTSVDNVMLQLSGSYDKIWYNNADAKDAETNTWYFRVDSSGGWRLTPTLSFTPSVYYLNSTDSYQRTQLLPSGDPLLPPVSISNYGNTKSQDLGGGLLFNYLVSPNLTLGIGGRYSQRRFTSDNVAGSGLTNSTSAGGEVSLTYLVSPRTTVGLLLAGNHQTYENEPDSDTYSAGVIYGYQFTPLLRLDTTLGAQHIRTKSAPGVPAENKTAPSGIFNLAYTSGTFNGRFYGSGVYAGGSGYGEATRQGTLGLSFSDRFTREWSWNINGTYQIEKSVFNTDAINITTIYAHAGVQYQFLEWASMDLSGNLSRQTSDGQFGNDINNYSGILGFTIGKPYNLY